MAEVFSPEDLKIRNSEGLQFYDAWGLTCSQLGRTVGMLLDLRPEARLTKSDLVGYHSIQYGMDSDTVLETIDAVQAGMWKNWDEATDLRETLSKVLGQFTTGALMQRIRLGDEKQIQKIDLDPRISQYFNTVEETDPAHHEVQSLYPLPDSELEFRGRVSVSAGKVVIGGILGEHITYTDILQLASNVSSHNQIVVVTTTTHGTRSTLSGVNIA